MKFKTINNVDMIECGNYNWEILKENDGTEIYKLVIKTKKEHQNDIMLMYGEGILSVRNFMTTYNGGDFFCFKMFFEETPILVEQLINGEGGYLLPIYNKNTVKIKYYY